MENRVIFSLEDQILLSYNPPQSHDLEIKAKPIGFNKDRDTPGLDFLPFFFGEKMTYGGPMPRLIETLSQ